MSNLSCCRTVVPSFKRFVRGSEVVSNLNETHRNEYPEGNKLSGAVAKRTYERVVGRSAIASVNEPCEVAAGSSSGDSCDSPSNSVAVRAPPSNSVFKTAVSVNKLMRFAEQDDVKSLSSAIGSDDNLLNAVDDFGWTPLMCASCAGSVNVVAYLLKAGADLSVRDKRGNSCTTLARKRGCVRVLNMLKNQRKTQNCESESSKPQHSPAGSFYCTICKCTVPESNSQNHLTSTVHLLCSGKKNQPTLYGIPEHNRGYQILLRHGWDREHGLGPEGKGKKLPPKTVLKTDRKGIGAMKQKPRVTHFGANDVAAVSSVRVKALNESRKRRRHFVEDVLHDKRVERKLRRELS